MNDLETKMNNLVMNGNVINDLEMNFFLQTQAVGTAKQPAVKSAAKAVPYLITPSPPTPLPTPLPTPVPTPVPTPLTTPLPTPPSSPPVPPKQTTHRVQIETVPDDLIEHVYSALDPFERI